MFAVLISAAFSAPTGRAGGGSAGIPGSGGSGRCLIAAGGPAKTFSGCLSHSASGSANFAPDGSKLRSTPAKVEITIAANSSNVARLKFFMVRKFASMNFCSSLCLSYWLLLD